MAKIITEEKLTFITETCYKCGCHFAMEEGNWQSIKDNKDTFCCPFGHKQQYIETTEQKLRRELKAATDKVEAMITDRGQRITEMAQRNRQLTRARNKLARLKQLLQEKGITVR